ncbi:hypothetical protein H0O01_04210 [Candidatus Micrarchaeota archaeon]|nr:hypothetical protein [Candidatus Micrarchaeota archaeon]
MNSKKGQAAAEYLVTYGWALLLLVAVIAIILSTGIFNPSYFISEECVLQPDIACTGYQMYRMGGDQDAILMIGVENRLGYDMKLDNVKITTNDLGVAGEKVWGPQQGVPVVLRQGDNVTLRYVITGEKQPAVDSMQRMRVELTYYSCAREVNPDCVANAEYLHTVAGRITVRVAKG